MPRQVIVIVHVLHMIISQSINLLKQMAIWPLTLQCSKSNKKTVVHNKQKLEMRVTAKRIARPA